MNVEVNAWILQAVLYEERKGISMLIDINMLSKIVECSHR